MEHTPPKKNTLTHTYRKRRKWMDDFVSCNSSTNFASESRIFKEAQKKEFKDEWNEAINTEYNY